MRTEVLGAAFQQGLGPSVVARSPDRAAPRLWPGLLTGAPGPTAGLPVCPGRDRETCGRSRGRGQETTPQLGRSRGRGQETTPQLGKMLGGCFFNKVWTNNQAAGA